MITEGDNFEDRDFVRGLWHQTATMVALVTTEVDGQRNVMACEWAMMVTRSPLRFVIAIGPRKVTHDLIQRSGEFGLSFCSDEQATLSHVAGSYSLRDTDKWSLADFPTYPAKTIAAPMIDDCLVNVECRLIATQELGDHTLFMGEATWARFDATKEPLLYSGGKYHVLGANIPKPRASDPGAA